MRKFLKHYRNENEERMNFGLIERRYDDDLIELVVDSFKSLEVVEHINFLGYEVVEDEKDIDMTDFINRRSGSKNSKSKKPDPKYIKLQDSRQILLKMKCHLSCKGEEMMIEKDLLVPFPDENGYFTIKGKKYFLMYQLVDASTYKNQQSIILKSFMPIEIKRLSSEYKDTTGENYIAPIFEIKMFNKTVSILPYYFARKGVTETLRYFKVDKIINFVEDERDTNNNIYFRISKRIYLEVNKHLFFKHHYVQSLAFMILNVVSNRLSFEDLDNRDYWIEKIGSASTTSAHNFYEKGNNSLVFFERMVDETTKKILKIHNINKKDIYSVVKWIIQNFNELRKKDNLDLANKRLRCNEYIASLLTREFSTRINRIISSGDRVTLRNVEDVFKFRADIILRQLYNSGLLKYDDRINDMDFYSKLKYTLKGPNSLGGKNSKNISTKYRGIHPSYIGLIDINVCGY